MIKLQREFSKNIYGYLVSIKSRIWPEQSFHRYPQISYFYWLFIKFLDISHRDNFYQGSLHVKYYFFAIYED